MNLYGFVGNSPVHYVDDKGKNPFVVAGVIVAAGLTVYNVARTLNTYNNLFDESMQLRTESNEMPTTHPDFRNRYDNVADGLFDLVEGTPHTSLTGPGGIPTNSTDLASSLLTTLMENALTRSGANCK